MSQDIGVERRLAAVLAADVAGFSRLTEADEIGTLRLLAAQRAILDSSISRHRGRIANTAGDSVLAEFPSAVNAVQCAVEAQQALREAAEEAPADRRVLFRIGIHVGDVMVQGGDLLGTGVNVAARLEALADAGGIVLSAAAHEHVKKILPHAYADLGLQSVKNIEEPVRAFAIGAAPARIIPSASEAGAPLALPDKPSIAVLPFQNMSGDPEQEYFADGVVEDIITALSRFRELFVIARNSSFTYKGKAVDIKQVGRELGVRYVLEGSVRKAGSKVRITGQLIEAATGTHLWADRIDGSAEQIFELQDQVTIRVVGAVAPSIDQSEADRAMSKSPGNLGAYDCLLRGRRYLRLVSFEDNKKALDYCNEAISLDPTSARAHALAAMCYFQRLTFRWTEDRRAAISDGTALARKAVLLGQGDANALTLAANFIAFYERKLEVAENIVDQAISINPNHADAWRVRGWISVWLERPQEAILQLETALRLSPVDLTSHDTYTAMAAACLHSNRPDQAIIWAEKALARRPAWLAALAQALVAHVEIGNLEEARRKAESLRAVNPDYASAVRQLPFKNPDSIARFEAAYREVGLLE